MNRTTLAKLATAILFPVLISMSGCLGSDDDHHDRDRHDDNWDMHQNDRHDDHPGDHPDDHSNDHHDTDNHTPN